MTELPAERKLKSRSYVFVATKTSEPGRLQVCNNLLLDFEEISSGDEKLSVTESVLSVPTKSTRQWDKPTP